MAAAAGEARARAGVGGGDGLRLRGGRVSPLAGGGGVARRALKLGM